MADNLRKTLGVALLAAALLMAAFGAGSTVALADNFGGPGNQFTIDFVDIRNAGNANDSAAGGAFFSPLGGVAYNYRIAVTETPLNWVTKAIANGLTDVSAEAASPNHPAGLVVWHEAAAFVNWLNTSTGHHPAYNLTFNGQTTGEVDLWETEESWGFDPVAAVAENRYRHKDSYYFLPSDSEWYKAAFHKNDGATGNYWDYANGSDTAPTATTGGSLNSTAVFQTDDPATVNNAGGLSPYGARGLTGNVMEWSDSASPEGVTLQGGWYGSLNARELRSSNHSGQIRADSHLNVGFRVASVPEPSAAVLLLCGAGVLLAHRRRRVA